MAVVPVMLFHAGISGFSGGYVGVDVFFVISGFLITSMIAEEMGQARFSIIKFYERRVRRIFPALFSVLGMAAVAAWLILTPADLKDFGQSLLSTATFSSNVLFWLQTDYFDGPAHLKPLLHTWSLAVEEQFYIVFPPVLWLLMRFWRGRVRHSIMALLVVSFAASLWTMTQRPASAFYLSPQRGWELLIGCALALGAVPALSARRARAIEGALGVALIAFAVVGYNDKTAFPGATALAPCLGAGMVIHAGAQHADTAVGRALSLPSVVFVGKISYSLYLWHWPLLVLAGYLKTTRLDVVNACGVLLLSFVLSALSWRYVEQPFRHGLLPRRGALFAMAAAVSVAAIVGGGALHVAKGFPKRVDDRVIALDAARNDRNPDRGRCHASDDHPVPWEAKCRYGAQGVAPTAAIWGDSFAAEIAVALGERAQKAGRSMLYASYSACAPAVGVYAAERPACDAHNRDLLAHLLADRAIVDVVLVSRHERHVTEYGGAYLTAFGDVATALQKAGKRVVVTYPIPKPPAHVPTMLAQFAHRGRDLSSAFIERVRFEAGNAETVRFLDALTQPALIVAARPSDRLCSIQRCEVMVDDQVLYFDENHLSLTGARYILPIFEPLFSETPP